MITHVASALPEWAVGVIAVLVAGRYSLPRVLRALDDRRIVKTACKTIVTERCAVEALRIRNSPFHTPSDDRQRPAGSRTALPPVEGESGA